MVFAAYLLENSILVLSRGVEFASYFLAPPWGICSFSRTKCQMPGGMGMLRIDWAINDPVSGPGEGPAPLFLDRTPPYLRV